ncbi:FAD-binding domain-containing protein [Lophiostoma macrostomum CBS 122681]|uniref:FAD-binding domain-containing protein n=1 Tax=Lophiostoma macrostomum CBS 122681 TaxID=1314788 RepID=A0A6A6SKI2_9PLEO|nr:FAD-binding domain-containing protein [Lophiostoma macrostomum CBS 122681]
MVHIPGAGNGLLAAQLFSFTIAAAIPDKNAIWNEIKQSGACCTALNYFLPDKVHYNNLTDLGYQSSQLSFWSAQEAALQPTCIVVPTSSQDVSLAVTILSLGFQAGISGCQFAVRGAGHTPWAGAANIDGGVTIDTQSLNQVTVSSNQGTVSVGPGNRWGNVYPTLDNLNVAMVGGRLSHVGVGGLVIGGGISFFSGRYGFACDNLQAIEIVLANGTVATASSSKNADLFKALKGGTNNFGVVTRFDAKLYPQKPFWGGTIVQPATNKEALFDFFVKFTNSSTYDPYAALITNFAWLEGIPSVINDVVYTNGDVAWPPPTYAPLDTMAKILSTMRVAHLSNITDELAASAAATNGHNNLLTTVTFVNKGNVSAEFMSQVFDLADATAKQLITVVGLVYTMTLQPLPYTIYSKSAATGGNVLGLDRFNEDLINLLFTLSWQLPTDNVRVEAAMQQLESDILALEKQMGVFNEFVYLNYAAQWQDPISGYGDNNVQFLKSVSKKYDPNGVFQKGVPGGFKVGT